MSSNPRESQDMADEGDAPAAAEVKAELDESFSSLGIKEEEEDVSSHDVKVKEEAITPAASPLPVAVNDIKVEPKEEQEMEVDKPHEAPVTVATEPSGPHAEVKRAMHKKKFRG